MSDEIFKAMINLLLDQRDYTIGSMLILANAKYELPETEETRARMALAIKSCGDSITLLPTQQYHKAREFCNLEETLEFMSTRPADYFEGRPGLRRFFSDFQEKYGPHEDKE